MYPIHESTSMLSDIFEFDCTAGTIYESGLIATHQAELAGDRTILMEGLDDICSSIGKAIKDLIQKIIKFFKDIIRAIVSLGMDVEQFTKAYKKDLDNISNVNFSINGYEFNVFKAKTPDMTPFQELISSFNSSLADVDSLKKEDLTTERLKWFNESNLDKLRGKILGTDNPIPEDKFNDEIKIYYKGSTEPKNINITTSTVNDIVSHASELISAKKKAENDRDKLIRLLNSAELFFRKKVDIGYRGTDQVVNTKSVSVDNNTFKTSTLEKDIPGAKLAIVQNLIGLQYDKTRKLSSIITNVVTERAKAFRDQAKQERAILGKALTKSKSTTTSSTEESYLVHELYLERQNTDYVEETALETTLANKQYYAERLNALSQQSDLVLESLAYGSMKGVPLTEGAIQNLIQKIKDMIKEIILEFKRKGFTRDAQYGAWLRTDGVQQALVKSAHNYTNDIEVLPYWETNSDADINAVTKLVNSVAAGCKDTTGKVNWFSMLSDFTDDKSLDELKESAYQERLNNRFINGKKSGDQVERAVLHTSALATRVRDMCTFINKYKPMANKMESLSKKIATIDVQESIGYLDIEQCPITESSLMVLLEDGEDKEKSAEVKSDTGVTTNAPKNGDVQNASQSAKDAEDATGQEKKPAQSEEQKFVINYMKSAVASFCTINERKYADYVKILLAICPKAIYPLFDDKGNYTGLSNGKDSAKDVKPDNNVKADESNTNETQKKSTDDKKEEPKEEKPKKTLGTKVGDAVDKMTGKVSKTKERFSRAAKAFKGEGTEETYSLIEDKPSKGTSMFY